jgi:hypothetical protein
MTEDRLPPEVDANLRNIQRALGAYREASANLAARLQALTPLVQESFRAYYDIHIIFDASALEWDAAMARLAKRFPLRTQYRRISKKGALEKAPRWRLLEEAVEAERERREELGQATSSGQVWQQTARNALLLALQEGLTEKKAVPKEVREGVPPERWSPTLANIAVYVRGRVPDLMLEQLTGESITDLRREIEPNRPKKVPLEGHALPDEELSPVNPSYAGAEQLLLNQLTLEILMKRARDKGSFTDRDEDVLVGQRFLGETAKETAARIGDTPDNVRQIRHRALEKLRPAS